MVDLDLARGWRIACPEEHAVAAAELEAGLAALGGRPGGEIAFELAAASVPGEGYRWEARPEAVRIEGAGRRGLLNGVAGLLDALGLERPWPGRTEARPVPIAATTEAAPALPGRCLILGHREALAAAGDWIVWASRQRLNTVFVHVSTQADPFGAAPEALWLEQRDRLTALVREHGMTLEHGGHLLPELVPEAALAAAGRGEPEALQAAVAAHVRAHPEADVLHLWGADTAAGARTGTERSERALRVTNAVAEAVERVAPAATVASLAYHDTLALPAAVRPRPNVCLLWAPRERSYAEPADAGEEWALFERHVAHYAVAGARPPRVFEYYLDLILFDRGLPDLGAVMAADLAAYAAAGVHTVQALMTAPGPWPAPHPNAERFARLAWDPAAAERLPSQP
jgi:hypothetical protein